MRAKLPSALFSLFKFLFNRDLIIRRGELFQQRGRQGGGKVPVKCVSLAKRQLCLCFRVCLTLIHEG